LKPINVDDKKTKIKTKMLIFEGGICSLPTFPAAVPTPIWV
jgi:hypothetical protein